MPEETKSDDPGAASEDTIDPSLIETDDDRKLAEMLGADVKEDKSAGEKPKEEAKSEEPAAEPTSEPSQEHLDAIQVLRRGKVPTALIDRLSADEAVKMAADLKPIQAEGDTLGNRYAQLKKELEELRATKEEPVEPDLTPYKKSLSSVEEDIGKDASDAIAKLLATRDQEQKSEFDKKVSELEERVMQIQVGEYHRELSTARDTLLNDFPRLKNAASYDAVLERTKSLMSASDSWERYRGDLKLAMREASKLELGTHSEKFAGEHNARVSSQQSTQQDTTVASSKPLDRDAADDMILEALENGNKGLAEEIEARFQRENGRNY